MERKTGVVVPLAALYTEECQAVGEFTALKKFADFCKKSGFGVIQLLPLNDTGTQSSPYSGLSAFALHPLYINIEALPEFDEALKKDKAFASAYKSFKKEFKYKSRFDYEKLNNEKIKLLHLIYSYLDKSLNPKKKSASQQEVTAPNPLIKEMDKFTDENPWIIEYAVYKNLKDIAMQASWKEWDENFQHLSKSQIKTRWNNKALKTSHNFFVWCQLRAAEQFKDAADYVRSLGITLKGDIPILMNEDSADAWAWPEYFNQTQKAGSPPDGENPVGQNWGFPTYNWDNLAKDNYSWWKSRVKTASQYYSAFRIDHVLGFFRIWAINNADTSAYLGHTSPCRMFTRDDLHSLGFDDGRIKWLSEPHIATSVIEDITWNHEQAVNVLEKVCTRIGNEELWNFKEDLKGDKEIFNQSFFPEDKEKDDRIKYVLSEKWRDRALIKQSDIEFTKVWKCEDSTAWKSLNDDEKNRLYGLFNRCESEENTLWKDQAEKTLGAITGETDMTACAEDLGVNLPVLPEVLGKLNILSLRVIRWNRWWDNPGQPYAPYNQYPLLSVATTSVHDSSTLRQWWSTEKDSVNAYINMWNSNDKKGLFNNSTPVNSAMEFDAQVADFCLESSALCKSAWFINPLQDYLYLNQKYYLKNMDDERINIPGSVNDFNWTYRLPVSVEELLKDEELISKIKTIVKIHNEYQ